ncbi:MAG: cytochrome C biosynthesis protein, partial [Bacteroides sp.]
MKLHTASLFLLLLIALSGCNAYHPADRQTDERPIIYPSYEAVTFPCNIAPPNFKVCTEGERYQVELGVVGEEPAFHVSTIESTVTIPPRQWRKLTEQSLGKSIYFRISIRHEGEWVRYADITNRISEHPIDAYLTYRLLYPGYELWNEMGIYQRELSSYKETPIVENRNFGHQCVNCHSYNQYRPDEMML